MALIEVPVNFLLSCCCLLTALCSSSEPFHLAPIIWLEEAVQGPCPAPAKILPVCLHRGFRLSTQSHARSGSDSLTPFYTPAPQDPSAQVVKPSHSSPYCATASLWGFIHISPSACSILAHLIQLTFIQPSKHSFNFTSSWTVSHLSPVIYDCLSVSTML